ncbi:uncharacterized protein EV154DRAFT_229503 [Mucor mucedo]|uniref:uncharacterized protein n=1 Tax=Mucor mucedo TaxID=29922 RepID=UPI0022200B95|nr:uncharacterized protein EV154DRAFT_229503 [Mucor mucedo]KAI7891102.1 hypothetical protein EV154DRAFT_229503 [Mucor mucedo]
MANFPTWINKNKSTINNSSNLSPRQVANKAYSLAIKKLDKDDKRRRPQYTVRERLLLSNTMTRAEDLLNKRTSRLNRRVLAVEHEEEVVSSPIHTPPPPPLPAALLPPSPSPPVAAPAPAPTHAPTPVPSVPVMTAPTAMAVVVVKNDEVMVTPAQIKHNESRMITPEQIAVSLAVVAVAAYSSLSAEQNTTADFFSDE